MVLDSGILAGVNLVDLLILLVVLYLIVIVVRKL